MSFKARTSSGGVFGFLEKRNDMLESKRYELNAKEKVEGCYRRQTVGVKLALSKLFRVQGPE
jgi:hypothetical protein